MPPSPRRPIVLLVEDSEDDAFFFRLSLRRASLDCDLIHLLDGKAAITYLAGCMQAEPQGRVWPDLVFLDLKIPGVSGFELLEWIRDRSLNPNLEITVLSGSEHARDVERAMALGACGYIVKPIQREQLAGRFTAWQERQKNAAPPAAKSLCALPETSA